MKRTATRSIVQKVVLILFGLVIGVIILEGSLRLGGYILQVPKRAAIYKQRSTKKDVTILCLGESTTDGQWPSFLESLLQESVPNKKIIVIDEGKRCLNSGVIVSQLERNLDVYTPDIVITMMGINDWIDTVPFAQTLSQRVALFFMDFRVYKLGKLVWVHIVHAVTGERVAFAQDTGGATGNVSEYERLLDVSLAAMNDNDLAESQQSVTQAMAAFPNEHEVYIRQAWLYEKEQRINEARNAFSHAYMLASDDARVCLEYGSFLVEQNDIARAFPIVQHAYQLEPDNAWALFELGNIYFLQKKYEHATDLFEQALRVSPDKHDVYMMLGRIYSAQAEYARALFYYQKGVALMPDNSYFVNELAECYLNQGDEAQALKLLGDARKKDPSNLLIYKTLARVYELENERNKALAVLQEAYEVDPSVPEIIFELARMTIHNKEFGYAEKVLKKALMRNNWNKSEQLSLYDYLGRCYIAQDKSEDVESLYAQALQKFPEEDRLHASLALFYLERGDEAKARRYFSSADKLRRHYVNAVTQYNYTKLKQMVLDHGATLVCVQYPMRSVEPLKMMLQPHEETVFVDNEELFKSAVTQEGYETFFEDNFAGDFGHCTDKGNQLLARNIADVLCKKYFRD